MLRLPTLIALFTVFFFLFSLTGNMLVTDPDFSSIAFAKKKDKGRDKGKDKDKDKGKKFEKKKEKALENIKRRSGLLNDFENCVKSADSREELKSCRKKNKEEMKAIHSEKKEKKEKRKKRQKNRD